jgi:replication-associated recombination protein RarA
MTTEAPILDMTADELRAIARKLLTYAYVDIRAADEEAEKMAKRCWEIAALLDAANARKLSPSS